MNKDIKFINIQSYMAKEEGNIPKKVQDTKTNTQLTARGLRPQHTSCFDEKSKFRVIETDVHPTLLWTANDVLGKLI
jgi:hypothetical protein